MKLWEIDEAILECVDLETGEILDTDKLNALNMERDEKIERVCQWYKNELADADALEEQENIFKERKLKKRAKAEQLKTWIDYACGGVKREFTTATISYRKTTKVEISNMDKLPGIFKKVKTEVTADKMAIKDAYKKGIEVEGAVVIEDKSCSIK